MFGRMRTAPGLIVVLATLLCATPAVEAAPCKGKRACKAQAKAKKSPKPKDGTGWINGTYNGGPGDPIIAPLPSLPG
jgi:hypothetical protein